MIIAIDSFIVKERKEHIRFIFVSNMKKINKYYINLDNETSITFKSILFPVEQKVGTKLTKCASPRTFIVNDLRVLSI